MTAICRDQDLRYSVHTALAAMPAREQSVVVDEFSVCRAQARIDIAVVGDHLAGFELKSDVDRLDRLRSQIPQYGRVFDRLTLVVGERHVARARHIVPDWWGIWLVGKAASDPLELRAGSLNPTRCARSVAGLLWRDEMLAVAEQHGFDHIRASWPRRRLIDELSSNLGPDQLHRAVLRKLRSRLAAAVSSTAIAAEQPA